MKNPFKIGEKVRTKVGRGEVEAVVTKVWQNEVQVRTPDNELRWRSMYTVWYPGAAPLARSTGATNTSKPAAAIPAKTGRAKTKQPSGKQSRKRR